MKVLVVGGGGREHAIVDALTRSPQVEKIYCAPGNAGIALQAECIPVSDHDIEGLLSLAAEKQVDLTVVGPEIPLSLGIVSRFRGAGMKIFGPSAVAACVESSKDFAKMVMTRHGIPTAAYRTFTCFDYDEAVEYVRGGSFPVVLKYDGLAAGKGVVIPETFEDAERELKEMLLEGKFGEGKVVVEEYLTGPEFSLMCFVSGEKVWPMPIAQDHKRAFDGDKGPNTGGMGAYTQLPFITEEDRTYALEHIMKPMAAALVKEDCPFTGVLYGGLMKTPDGIKVIEFNCRFGDPETEVVLPLLDSDIADVFLAVAEGRDPQPLVWSDDVTMGVVLASKGYPGAYEKGCPIKGLDDVTAKVYHMGTKTVDGHLVTAGGRVMMTVVRDKDIHAAQKRVYDEIAKIDCPALFWRTDIAHWALK